MHWHAGHNTVGCLPDTAEPAPGDADWHIARAALVIDLEWAWNMAEEAGKDTASYLDAHTALHHATPGQDVAVTTTDDTLPEQWWIHTCQAQECTVR